MTPTDLDGKNFLEVPAAAEALGGVDERTLRRAISQGDVPAIRVGLKWLVPTPWIRQQIYRGSGGSASTSADNELDLDRLAEQISDKVVARILSIVANALGSS